MARQSTQPGRFLTRTVLREQLKEVLLERILEGSYRPGERLVETQIAKEFGTSQAPVREALRDLEALRLVQAQPFRGARVRHVSTEELIEVYPVRAALEEVAAAPATARLAGDVTRLKRELDGMRAAARKGDLHALVQHDASFHRLIVEASGNSVLIELWNSLSIEARTTITAVAAAIDPAHLAEMHQPILDAIAVGDAQRAAREMRDHIEYFGELLTRSQHLRAGDERTDVDGPARDDNAGDR